MKVLVIEDDPNNMMLIIAITSSAMANEREKLIKSGCNGYFEIPINPLNIIDDIEKILGEKIRRDTL